MSRVDEHASRMASRKVKYTEHEGNDSNVLAAQGGRKSGCVCWKYSATLWTISDKKIGWNCWKCFGTICQNLLHQWRQKSQTSFSKATVQFDGKRVISNPWLFLLSKKQTLLLSLCLGRALEPQNPCKCCSMCCEKLWFLGSKTKFSLTWKM